MVILSESIDKIKSMLTNPDVSYYCVSHIEDNTKDYNDKYKTLYTDMINAQT